MPPIVPQPRLLQIVPYYDLNTDINHNIANVLWFQSNSAGTPSQANLASISQLFDLLWPHITDTYMATGKHYIGNVTTDFSSTMGLSWDTRGNFTPHAGASGSPNPSNVCALISYSNGERYRGGHFRTYLPYVGDTALQPADVNNITAGVVSQIEAAVNTVISGMQASNVLGGQTWVLYRHRTDPTKAALFGIHSFAAQQRLATQRRRLRKVPRHSKSA
jgi:hypothetical protein